MPRENFTIEEIIKGITCETCSEERVFGHPPNDESDNKYIYIDLGGSTRCFCKKHMSYRREDSPTLLKFDEDWDFPCFGAELISDILNNLVYR